MRRQGISGATALLLVALVVSAVPQPVLAGRFEVISVSTPTLANTGTGFEFAVHGAARWEGDSSTSGFNRIIRSFWWTSEEDWCSNAVPGKHCGTIGRPYAAPFNENSILICTSQNGCAANKGVPKPCCNAAAVAYRGKIDVLNLHGGTDLDDAEENVPKTVPCRECPGPGGGPEPDIPCSDPVPQLHVGPVIGALPLGVEAAFSNFPLQRVEFLRGVHYVMEEWAILVVERDAAGALVSTEVSAASSAEYAAQQRQSFIASFTSHGGLGSPVASGTPERAVLLVVHHPNHPHNERWIPMPQAQLAAGSLSGEAPEGRAVIRADFAEDRTLSALDILYSDRPLTTEELAFLESDLSLLYANDDQHRVVLYGVVQLSGATIDLENYMPIPSMCCCPSEWPDCNGGGP